MKAILTLNEMPENCEECPFNYDMFTCLFIPHSSTILMDSERLDGCPLKEFPERKNTISLNNLEKEAEVNHVKVDAQAGFNLGWNACLDEIRGTEDSD